MVEDDDMSYEVSYNSTLHIVEILFAGELNTSALKDATSEIIRVSLERGCTDFLLDSRMQMRVQSMADLYYLPQSYLTEGLDPKSRAAIILSKSGPMRQDSLFWETVCTNLGLKVRSFESREEAIAWLRGTNISNKGDTGNDR